MGTDTQTAARPLALGIPPVLPLCGSAAWGSPVGRAGQGRTHRTPALVLGQQQHLFVLFFNPNQALLCLRPCLPLGEGGQGSPLTITQNGHWPLFGSAPILPLSSQLSPFSMDHTLGSD